MFYLCITFLLCLYEPSCLIQINMYATKTTPQRNACEVMTSWRQRKAIYYYVTYLFINEAEKEVKGSECH